MYFHKKEELNTSVDIRFIFSGIVWSWDHNHHHSGVYRGYTLSFHTTARGLLFTGLIIWLDIFHEAAAIRPKHLKERNIIAWLSFIIEIYSYVRYLKTLMKRITTSIIIFVSRDLRVN